MDSFHHSEQATNMSASGLSDRSSLPMGDNFHHPEHGSSMSSGGLSDRSPLPLGVEQDQPVQAWPTTATQEDVAADYSMFPATQPEGDYSSQQMTDIVHQTYMHSGLTQSDTYEGDHLRDMTRPQGLDMFSSRGLSMSDSYEPRGSLNDQHPVEVYEPRGNLGDQHAMELFQMKDVSQDSVNKGKDVPSVGRVMSESRSQASIKMGEHLTDSRHLGLSDVQDLRRVGISGIQTLCKPGVSEDSSQYAVLDMHYNNRPNMEVTSASSMSDSRYQSLIDSMTMAQRVNDSRNLSAASTSRHLLPALSPQYADERPPRMVNPQYSANHTNRQGRPVANMDTYCTKTSADVFQAENGDSQGADRNVALSQHRSVQRNSVDVFSDRSASSFGQQMFEDSVRTSSSRTPNNNANFAYSETSAPIVKARHLCFQEEEDVQSKAAGTSVSFSFVDNSVPMSKMSHQMYDDSLRTSQAPAGHSEFGGGMLSASGSSSQGSDVVLGRGDQEVLLTDKDWNHVTRLKLFHLMTNKKMCDVALKSGDLRIEIHKVVLCAASDQLAMLLDSVDSDGFPVLSTSTQVSEGVLHAFAEFLYLGQVKINIDNISEMNTLANAFHIYALHDICLELLEKNGPGGSNRLLDLKLTFETHGSPTVQRTDCGINTDDNVGLESSSATEADDSKQSAQSVNKTNSAGKSKSQSRNRGKGRSQGKSKSLTEEKKEGSMVERTDGVTHSYGTRGVVKKQQFEESVLNENNINKFNQKPAAKTPLQTAPKRKRVNSSKSINTESAGETTNKPSSAAASNSEVAAAAKDSESVAKAPVKPRHRSLKQKLMESVTEDSALDNPAMVNSNPLAKLMIVEENNTASEGLEDTSDYTSLKGKKGKKARARKFLVAPHVQMTVRPPPKKRAKMELKRLKQEEEELGLSLSLLEENIDDLPLTFMSEQDQGQEVKTPDKVTKPKKPQKQRRCRFAKTDAIGQMAVKLESLAAHIRVQLRQYKCDLCGNEFVFPKRSITHLMNTHNVELTDVMSYVTIRERVEESPKICDICGYKSKDANFYYIHIHKYFRHGIPLPKGWKPYTCDICGKELFTKFQLKDHRRIHFEETPFICQVCGQGFKSRTCLNSHVFHRHSDERKHQCGECSKSFKTRTQLLVHTRTHSGEKPYQCPECLYKSTTRGNMRLHLTNRHKLDPQAARSLMQQVTKGSDKFADVKQGLEQDVLENQQTFGMAAATDASGSVPVTTTTTTTITLTDKSVLAEHAMHAILLPLAQGEGDGSSLSSQTIATYVVTGSVPLTGEMGGAITIGEPANQSSIGQQEPQVTTLNSTTQGHIYMQHSPISPPPQSVSPQSTYVTTAHSVTSLSPVNLPASQQQASTLVTDDSISSGSDAAIIQAYYQQQFYTHY